MNQKRTYFIIPVISVRIDTQSSVEWNHWFKYVLFESAKKGVESQVSSQAQKFIFWSVWEITYLRLYKRNILMPGQAVTQTEIENDQTFLKKMGTSEYME